MHHGCGTDARDARPDCVIVPSVPELRQGLMRPDGDGTMTRRKGKTVTLNAQSTQAEKNAHYRWALQTYADRVSAQDVDGICALFADDAEVDDPVGGPMGVLKGAAAVRAFYEATATAKVHLEVAAPITGSRANKAILPLHIQALGTTMNCNSVATFNDEGKIIRYEAHWGPGDHTPADVDPLEAFLAQANMAG